MISPRLDSNVVDRIARTARVRPSDAALILAGRPCAAFVSPEQIRHVWALGQEAIARLPVSRRIRDVRGERRSFGATLDRLDGGRS